MLFTVLTLREIGQMFKFGANLGYFHGTQVVDTEDMWVRKLEELVQRGVIPHPRTLGK